MKPKFSFPDFDKIKKIPLQSGGFLVVEDSNPYDTVESDEMLYERSSDGMTPPESLPTPDLMELSAPQPHELLKTPKTYKKVGCKPKTIGEDVATDRGIDMKKALEIACSIVDNDRTFRVDARVELDTILKEVSRSLQCSNVNVSWDKDELVVRTGIKGERSWQTFKSLEQTIGDIDLARLATVRLILDDLDRLMASCPK